ncbi:long-chain-fatty-acid--CoA ligase [Roseibium album]|uniref:Long-chain-fatty-acid--CoA ligase n=1 Tax=Roseibium album TaxID=311410 RepID=A0A0M7AJ24_9HYPH|nr:long-chain fatty acid--CoA ligase [Roseibium album]CTQ59487.1 Long-chain-fatty-acid--CoA ligase [Roseibium album]CTQ65201.1 Long-chain-fatty-acid--CoA ligase [Roseibium album]CTQ75108.1 Long-chain-fatty-acid--CoA ligase [Roseibium album]
MTTAEEWNAAFDARPVHEYLESTVAQFGDRPAADFMGKVWTYSELGALVDSTAAGLQAMGVGPGVHVGLCLPNTPYYTIFYFAILKIGGTVANFNPLYVEREIAFQARDADVRIMVTMDLKVIYDKVEEVRKEKILDKIIVCPMTFCLPTIKKVLFSLFKRKELADIPRDEAHVWFDELQTRGNSPKPVEIDPHDDIAVLQYTGGTTGVPKGAMLTHQNLSANIEQMRCVFEKARLGEEKMLCVLPFFHVFAMTVAQNLSIILGAEMVLQPRFELKALLEAVKRKQVTLFPGVPTLYTAINNSPMTANYDLSSISLCLSGGAPLPVEVKQSFEKLTGCVLVEGYGLTESSPVAAVNPLDENRRAGSIGRLVPGTSARFVSIEDRTTEVAAGEKGELLLHGPQIMKGYWKRDDATADTITAEGYLHTGDVGYQDDEGFIYLVDRIKDLILCSGYNVYPRVIEEAIYQNEAVDETIVIAIPDEYRGQSPKAFIKLKEGHSMTGEDMKTFLKEHLSSIEMPREFEFRDELPKTMVGKLSKKELVEEEAQKRAQSEAQSA